MDIQDKLKNLFVESLNPDDFVLIEGDTWPEPWFGDYDEMKQKYDKQPSKAAQIGHAGKGTMPLAGGYAAGKGSSTPGAPSNLGGNTRPERAQAAFLKHIKALEKVVLTIESEEPGDEA